jgi:hypothetical protein
MASQKAVVPQASEQLPNGVRVPRLLISKDILAKLQHLNMDPKSEKWWESTESGS